MSSRLSVRGVIFSSSSCVGDLGGADQAGIARQDCVGNGGHGRGGGQRGAYALARQERGLVEELHGVAEQDLGVQFLGGDHGEDVVEVERERRAAQEVARGAAGRKVHVPQGGIGRDRMQEEVEDGRLALAFVRDGQVRRQCADGEVGAERRGDVTVDQRVVEQILQELRDGGDGEDVAHGRIALPRR
jgi:hypothetical protein